MINKGSCGCLILACSQNVAKPFYSQGMYMVSGFMAKDVWCFGVIFGILCGLWGLGSFGMEFRMFAYQAIPMRNVCMRQEAGGRAELKKEMVSWRSPMISSIGASGLLALAVPPYPHAAQAMDDFLNAGDSPVYVGYGCLPRNTEVPNLVRRRAHLELSKLKIHLEASR